MSEFAENPENKNSGSWMDKALSIVQQVNQLADVYKTMKSGTVNQTSGEIKKLDGMNPAGIDKFIQLVNQLGLGDKTIGDIIAKFSGYTPNQLKALGDKYGKQPDNQSGE